MEKIRVAVRGEIPKHCSTNLHETHGCYRVDCIVQATSRVRASNASTTDCGIFLHKKCLTSLTWK